MTYALVTGAGWRWIPVATILVALAPATDAAARTAPSGDVATAAEAFARGQAAELDGDHQTAAEFYRLAYEAAPTPEALRAAAKNHYAAGELARAAILAELLAANYQDEASTQLSEQLLAEAEDSLARLNVTCEPECDVIIGQRAVSLSRGRSHVVWVGPGEHEVVASFPERGDASRPVEVEVGSRSDVHIDAPEAPAPSPAVEARVQPVAAMQAQPVQQPATPVDKGSRARRRNLSPLWFIGGAVATAGLGAATAWSGADVLGGNEDYEAMPTEAGYQQGRRDEQRTNILIGGTAVVGAATIVLAVFTDWGRWKSTRKNARSSKVGLSFQRDGAGLSLRGEF